LNIDATQRQFRDSERKTAVLVTTVVSRDQRSLFRRSIKDLLDL